jgi:hypothetical protein
LAAILVVMALAVRIAVPSGWMPSAQNAFALTVCAGMDTHTVWLTKDGEIHKEDPSKGKAVDHAPCAFAGASAVADTPPAVAQMASVSHTGEAQPIANYLISVGHGLAAPPPPAIGPPILI